MKGGAWALKEAIRARLGAEEGTLRRTAERRCALVYPSPYAVGMSSLGYQTIYRVLNQAPGWSCERAFLPDDLAEWRSTGLPLLTYEGEQEVGASHLVALSVAYELEITGVI